MHGTSFLSHFFHEIWGFKCKRCNLRIHLKPQRSNYMIQRISFSLFSCCRQVCHVNYINAVYTAVFHKFLMLFSWAQVAEQLVTAIRESSSPPMDMAFFINYDAEDILRQAKESTRRYERGSLNWNSWVNLCIWEYSSFIQPSFHQWCTVYLVKSIGSEFIDGLILLVH